MDDQLKEELERIRGAIDHIDAQLIQLLNDRAKLAIEVGGLKGKENKPYFTPEREREIFEKLERENPGPLQNRQLTAIFREVISAARAAEKPLTVAYWGPAGTFTHMAALKTFGESATHTSASTIAEVFQAVEHGQADYGLVPLENSVAGVVPETLDEFPLTNVRICAEVYLPIHHHLLSHAQSLNQIRRVYAGPQPSQQCRHWLREHLPEAVIESVVPTSRAAEVAVTDHEAAAIANRMTADLTGLPVLREHIQDNANNHTRFLVIGFNEPARTGRDKTTVMFNLRNQPGALYRALRGFDEYGVNLLMIESRPAQRASFESNFFLDCVGHRHDETMCKALDELRPLTLEITVLGSYPMAALPNS
jgi:chorismate mutase/prephenate dehydratase